MLAPIYELLFAENKSHDREPSLELVEEQVVINYKTYKSDNADDMQAIVSEKLTPGTCIMSTK